MISIDRGPVRAVFRKEVRQFRRNRAIVVTMGILPLLFLTGPMINIFSLSASADHSTVRAVAGSVLLLMLVVPVILPATIAAYSVVGERDQGTLEPLLTTPIRRGELMLGKALAAVIPAVLVTYVLYALFVIAVHLWGTAVVFSDIWQTPQILVEVLFVPLLATWSICVGMAISVRSTDVRVAQQLSTLGSLPPLGLAILITFRVIPATVLSAMLIGLAFVILDGLACWGASVMLDRERLIAGRRAPRPRRFAKIRNPTGIVAVVAVAAIAAVWLVIQAASASSNPHVAAGRFTIKTDYTATPAGGAEIVSGTYTGGLVGTAIDTGTMVVRRNGSFSAHGTELCDPCTIGSKTGAFTATYSVAGSGRTFAGIETFTRGFGKLAGLAGGGRVKGTVNSSVQTYSYSYRL